MAVVARGGVVLEKQGAAGVFRRLVLQKIFLKICGKTELFAGRARPKSAWHGLRRSGGQSWIFRQNHEKRQEKQGKITLVLQSGRLD